MGAPLTRLELRRQRERLARFERFLPALRLRQQRLQVAVIEAGAAVRTSRREAAAAHARFDRYAAVLGDSAPLDVRAAARPLSLSRTTRNVAGVPVPVMRDMVFSDASHDLFATPPWVDRAVEDLREIARREAELSVAEEVAALLEAALRQVVQRVNLFEKMEIPDARRAIQRIRIHLGDEMAVAVGRAKLARARGPDATRTAGGGNR